MMKRKRILALLLCLGLVAGLTACGDMSSQGEDSSSGTDVSAQGAIPGINAENYPRVDGSTANMPLMAQIYSEVCAVTVEDAETTVNASGGTGAVWRNFMEGGADLLLVYEMPENVKDEFGTAVDEWEITPIGRDGLVFLVNNQNPVSDLSVDQLVSIYTGQATNWQEVGGNDSEIAAFQRNQESGSQTLFLKLLMQGREPMEAPTELVPAGMGALIDGIAAYDGSGEAIGYSVYYYANLMYENPDLKILSVDGIEPSTESIQSATYPLVNDFYVVIRKDAPENSPERLLRDWLLTEAGRDAMVASGYVPVI